MNTIKPEAHSFMKTLEEVQRTRDTARPMLQPQSLSQGWPTANNDQYTVTGQLDDGHDDGDDDGDDADRVGGGYTDDEDGMNE